MSLRKVTSRSPYTCVGRKLTIFRGSDRYHLYVSYGCREYLFSYVCLEFEPDAVMCHSVGYADTDRPKVEGLGGHHWYVIRKAV